MNKNEQIPQVNDVTRLSLGTEIKGALVSASDVRIDGILDGNIIISGKLVLGEDAVVTGRIICASADIWGKVSGKIVSNDLVTLRNNSSFKGDLLTNRIEIEVGAAFTGNCAIINSDDFKKIWDDLQKSDHQEIFSKLPECPKMADRM